MFTASNQNKVYCILNNWRICINVSCGNEVVPPELITITITITITNSITNSITITITNY